MNLELNDRIWKVLRKVCDRHLWDYLDEGFQIHEIEWAIDDKLEQFWAGLDNRDIWRMVILPPIAATPTPSSYTQRPDNK